MLQFRIPHSAFRTYYYMDNLIKIAGVRFHDNWKVYDFDAADLDVAVGDKVMIDSSDRGLGVALVVRLRKLPTPIPVTSSDRVSRRSDDRPCGSSR